MTDSAVLDRPDVEIILDEDLDTKDDDGTDNEIRHYFSKEDLDAQLFDGIQIRALCGYTHKGLARPSATGPICGKCKDIYNNVVGMNLPGRDGRDD